MKVAVLWQLYGLQGKLFLLNKFRKLKTLAILLVML